MFGAIISSVIHVIVSGVMTLNLAALPLVHHVNTITENEGRYAAQVEIDRINSEAGIELITLNYRILEDGSMVIKGR